MRTCVREGEMFLDPKKAFKRISHNLKHCVRDS